MPAFDALLEQPFAALAPEQRAAAATLGLDEAGWTALAAQAQTAEEAQTALRQHVPLFRYNALEDELHRLQAVLLEQSRASGGTGGRGRLSPTLSPTPYGGRRSPSQSEAFCPMCALAYVAEIRSIEEAQNGHFRYEIVLTQRGNDVVVLVLHKRFSEFVALRQDLNKQLRASSDLPIDADGDAAAELAPEGRGGGGGGGGGGGAEQASTVPLSRSLSSAESMKPYVDIVRTYPFPSKAPLRAAGGASRLAATRRPVLENWLNLVIKLARMEPLISFIVLSWLELDSVRDLSSGATQHSPTSVADDGASPPPMVL
jgi:hypothetical protein